MQETQHDTHTYVRFGILTAVSIEKTEFWDATPCSLMLSYPHVSDDPTISVFRVEELYLYKYVSG